jgi:hypothetical protein
MRDCLQPFRLTILTENALCVLRTVQSFASVKCTENYAYAVLEPVLHTSRIALAR